MATEGHGPSIDIERTLSRMNDREVDHYVRLFKLVDLDESGSITIEAIHNFRGRLGIRSESLIELEDWLALVDQVGDGEILVEEFCVFMHITRKGERSSTLAYLPGKGPKEAFQFANATWRGVIWKTLEDPNSSPLAVTISMILMGLITISVISFCVETVPAVQQNEVMMSILQGIELLCVGLFSLEFLLRFLSTDQQVSFWTSWLNIIDLVSLLPTYIELVAQGSGDSQVLRVARLARVARVFKLGRYLVWLRLYGNALRKARFPLAMAFCVCLLTVVIFASLIFYAERGVFDRDIGLYVEKSGELSHFQSIFDGCYWAIITITTVGYGDLAVKTTGGKVIGMCSLIVGILILAIPISIFSTHFQLEYTELKKQRQRQLQRRREQENAPNSDQDVSSLLSMRIRASTAGRGSRDDSKLQGTRPHPVRLHHRSKTQVVPQSQIEILENKLKDTPRELSAREALRRGLAEIEASSIKSLAKRNELRKLLLRRQIQRCVDFKREALWVRFRILERKFREELITSTLEKYATWFLRSDQELEAEIISAVMRIQRVFRGGLQRVLMSSKLVGWANRAKRTTINRVDAPPGSEGAVAGGTGVRAAVPQGMPNLVPEALEQ